MAGPDRGPTYVILPSSVGLIRDMGTQEIDALDVDFP